MKWTAEVRFEYDRDGVSLWVQLPHRTLEGGLYYVWWCVDAENPAMVGHTAYSARGDLLKKIEVDSDATD